MSGTQPVAVYAMKVPPGDILVPAVPDFAAMFRVSMAAIDPTAEPEFEDGDDKQKLRSTLKIVRVPGQLFDDDDGDSDEEDEDMDGLLDGLVGDDDEDEDSEADEEVNGGPSNREKSDKAKLLKMLQDDMEEEDQDMAEEKDDDEDSEDDDEADAQAILKKIMKSKKGKGKAVDGEEEASEDEDDEDDDAAEMEEVVVCTLDPEKNYQQSLDFVVGESERIFFKVTGTHAVHLTGNYVIPTEDVQARVLDNDDEDEEYDLEPDEDELDALEDEDEEEDELDDLADPRVAEIDDEDEVEAPKLVKNHGKGKNKRPAEDSILEEDDNDDDAEANLDDIVAKSLKAAEDISTTTGNSETKKLSKAEKKRLKKLKNNDGEAASAPAQPTDAKSAAKNGVASEKKVQFAKNLEQGPTASSTTPVKSEKRSDSKARQADSSGPHDVHGVTVDDRKVGNGPAAKKGSKVEMRYIGKLANGKQFDSNKKGKPFSFQLGKGEVIKGWDVGVEGIQVGGERRLVIPAHLAYGKQGAPPDIPPNATLTFDIKCLTVK